MLALSSLDASPEPGEQGELVYKITTAKLLVVVSIL